MILSSLAAVVLSASAFSPLSHLVHLHPKGTQPDTRVSIVLVNQSSSFRDVKVYGHSYTINSHGTLSITAPVGTAVFADSRTPDFHRGDVMLELEPANRDQRINIR